MIVQAEAGIGHHRHFAGWERLCAGKYRIAHVPVSFVRGGGYIFENGVVPALLNKSEALHVAFVSEWCVRGGWGPHGPHSPSRECFFFVRLCLALPCLALPYLALAHVRVVFWGFTGQRLCSRHDPGLHGPPEGSAFCPPSHNCAPTSSEVGSHHLHLTLRITLRC